MYDKHCENVLAMDIYFKNFHVKSRPCSSCKNQDSTDSNIMKVSVQGPNVEVTNLVSKYLIDSFLPV